MSSIRRDEDSSGSFGAVPQFSRMARSRGRDWLGRVKSEFDPNRLFTISLAELKVAITI